MVHGSEKCSCPAGLSCEAEACPHPPPAGRVCRDFFLAGSTTVTTMITANTTKTLLARWNISWYGEYRRSWANAYRLNPASSKKIKPSSAITVCRQSPNLRFDIEPTSGSKHTNPPINPLTAVPSSMYRVFGGGFSDAKACFALGSPCAAAMRYQRRAPIRSLDTPLPYAYI